MKKLLLIFSFSVFAVISGAVTLRERVSTLEKEAEKGDSAAMYHLSTLYEHGFDSIPADSLRSRILLESSARGGYAPAQNYLGFKLYPMDKDSAIYWLSRAAEGGEMKAAGNLAFILLEPDSTITMELREARERQAVDLLKKASSAGVPTAMASLADLYREGRGVEKDTLQAELLYLDAVSAGLQDAEMKLLSMSHARYARLPFDMALGEGLRAAHAGAHAVAFNLYKRAAEGEIPQAHTLLADAYSSAKGTDYNHNLALRHYAIAAFRGDPSAQFILAELLEIFPDALYSLINSDSIASSSLPLSPERSLPLPPELTKEIESDKEFSSPQYWYSLASQSGITSAREAFQYLFKKED